MEEVRYEIKKLRDYIMTELMGPEYNEQPKDDEELQNEEDK